MHRRATRNDKTPRTMPFHATVLQEENMNKRSACLVTLSSLLLLLMLFGRVLDTRPVQAGEGFDCANVSQIPLAECQALVAFYNATDGPHWIDRSGWLVTNTPCTWYGVICSSDHVTELALQENNLSGAVPAEIGDLASLQALRLHRNQLQSLPAEMGSLANLQVLGLSENQLSSLPPQIGNLGNLEGLHLSKNQLSSLPPQIGNLGNLRLLYLDNNQLSELPSEIGGLTRLYLLVLTDNQLSTLPSSIGDLDALCYLWVYGNRLTSLPAEIGDLDNICQLDLGNNYLSSLPPEIGNLTSLQELYLFYNQLTSLPPEISNLTYLFSLSLDHNQLSDLPAELGSLPRLYGLHLADNPLTGPIPALLTGLQNLRVLTFYRTDWCVPDDPVILAWLEGLSIVTGTGRVCGLPAGAFTGIVLDPQQQPLGGVEVALYQPLGNNLIGVTYTAGDGHYRFTDLGAGIEFRVHFADPAGAFTPEDFDDKPPWDIHTPVTVTLGMTRTGIDASLAAVAPPTILVHSDTGVVTANLWTGDVTINMANATFSDITVTRTVTCGGGTPPELVVLDKGTASGASSTYTMTTTGNDLYSATIPAGDQNEDAWLTIWVTCSGTTSPINVGDINLYDPIGHIKDRATGQPITGATVQLYYVPGWVPRTSLLDTRPDTCESDRSRPPGAPWSQPAPVGKGVLAFAYQSNPFLVPDVPQVLTDPAGQFGWDLSAACWFVKVTAPGYAPLVGPVFGVLSPITDLDLALLRPTDATLVPLIRR